MSYDLYFCTEGIPAPTGDALGAFFKAIPGVEYNDEMTAWWYENKNTEVTFSFEREPLVAKVDDDPDEESESPVPPGFVDARLAFNVNFLRPSFFGTVAFPVVQQLCESFGLLVVDPQAAEGHSSVVTPEAANSKALEQRWWACNVAAAAATEAKSTIQHWSHPRATHWFLYQHTKEMQERDMDAAGHDIFLPSLMLVTDAKASNALRTMIVWTDGIPFIFPPCDLVWVRTESKGWLGKSKVRQGIVDAEKLRAGLRPLLKEYSTYVGHLDMLPDHLNDRATRIAWDLKPDVKTDRITRIDMMGVVDDLP